MELTVAKFFDETKSSLKLKLLNDKFSFDRVITESDIHRPGLALTGFVSVFTYKRIQILGNTENEFLKTLSKQKLRKALTTLFSFSLPCIIITENNKPVPEFFEYANKSEISVLRTPFKTTKLMHLLSSYMDEQFAPTTSVHGTLVDVYGIGVLFTGRSGIGKSEIALDLIERGHRLVADDVVHIARRAGGILVGSASDMLQHHMEIRGLGIVDIKSIFGISSIRLQKRLEVEVQLEEWDDQADYERIGLDDQVTAILDIEIPVVKLPIFPGKNITVIAEVLALNQLMKIHGYHPAKIFNERLIKKMREKVENSKFLKDYLGKDFE